jgi:hypothetical protein
MKQSLITAILLMIVIILAISELVFQISALGLLVYHTQQQNLDQSDVVVEGTVINASGRAFERITNYTIAVERYLKHDLHQNILYVIGVGKKNSTLMSEDEPIFDVGQQVLLYLNKDGNEYKLSPYSYVLLRNTANPSNK